MSKRKCFMKLLNFREWNAKDKIASALLISRFLLEGHSMTNRQKICISYATPSPFHTLLSPILLIFLNEQHVCWRNFTHSVLRNEIGLHFEASSGVFPGFKMVITFSPCRWLEISSVRCFSEHKEVSQSRALSLKYFKNSGKMTSSPASLPPFALESDIDIVTCVWGREAAGMMRRLMLSPLQICRLLA